MESGTKLCQYLIHYILSVCALMDVEFFNVGIFPIVEKHSFRSSEATQFFFFIQNIDKKLYTYNNEVQKHTISLLLTSAIDSL